MRDKDLKKTSVNIPEKMYKRIDMFAESIGINRNSAMVYLLARGLEYEYDFENYMLRKKRKLEKEVVQDNIEKSIQKRIHERVKVYLSQEEKQIIYQAVEDLRFKDYIDNEKRKRLEKKSEDL